MKVFCDQPKGRPYLFPMWELGAELNITLVKKDAVHRHQVPRGVLEFMIWAGTLVGPLLVPQHHVAVAIEICVFLRDVALIIPVEQMISNGTRYQIIRHRVA
jgi:hypothetical protein